MDQGFCPDLCTILSTIQEKTGSEWGIEQQEAMDLLKYALTTPPVLVFLDYRGEAGTIILAVDSSFTG